MDKMESSFRLWSLTLQIEIAHHTLEIIDVEKKVKIFHKNNPLFPVLKIEFKLREHKEKMHSWNSHDLTCQGHKNIRDINKFVRCTKRKLRILTQLFEQDAELILSHVNISEVCQSNPLALVYIHDWFQDRDKMEDENILNALKSLKYSRHVLDIQIFVIDREFYQDKETFKIRPSDV